jgi:hypothetical protein
LARKLAAVEVSHMLKLRYRGLADPTPLPANITQQGGEVETCQGEDAEQL